MGLYLEARKIYNAYLADIELATVGVNTTFKEWCIKNGYAYNKIKNYLP